MGTMRKHIYFVSLFLFSFLVFGCASVQETSKVIWGSSTKALEERRVDGIKKTYQCRYQECFDEVIKIAQEQKLTVFIQDARKDLIVLMKIPGCVDTTEAGVFFSDLETETRLDIVSLSSKAQRVTSEILFSHLAEKYTETNQP